MFTEKPKERAWSSTTGFQEVRVWEGPGEDLADFYENIAPPGFIASRESRRPLGTVSPADTTLLEWIRVELTYGIVADTSPGSDPGLISRSWSLHGIDQQKGILSHDSTIPLFQREKRWPMRIKAAADMYVQNLEEQLKLNPAASPPAMSAYIPSAPSGATEGEIAKAQELFEILIRDPGASGFVTRHSLRKTEVVNSLTALKASHANVNRVFSHSGLVAEQTTLPSAALIDAAGLTAYLWLKRTPQVEQLGGGLWQIVQEWESGVYADTYLYGELITS